MANKRFIEKIKNRSLDSDPIINKPDNHDIMFGDEGELSVNIPSSSSRGENQEITNPRIAMLKNSFSKQDVSIEIENKPNGSYKDIGEMSEEELDLALSNAASGILGNKKHSEESVIDKLNKGMDISSESIGLFDKKHIEDANEEKRESSVEEIPQDNYEDNSSYESLSDMNLDFEDLHYSENEKSEALEEIVVESDSHSFIEDLTKSAHVENSNSEENEDHESAGNDEIEDIRLDNVINCKDQEELVKRIKPGPKTLDDDGNIIEEVILAKKPGPKPKDDSHELGDHDKDVCENLEDDSEHEEGGNMNENSQHVKELSEHTSGDRIISNDIYSKLLDYVCVETVKNLKDSYKSEIYKEAYTESLFSRYIEGDVDSSNPLFKELISEVISSNFEDPYLKDKTSDILKFIMEEDS